MRITITLNGVKVKKEIPTAYEQMSFKLFLSLEPCKADPVKMLSVITDIPEETIRISKIENISAIIQALSFFNQGIKYTLPKTILGYSIPKDLEFNPIAQYEDIKKELSVTATNLEIIQKYPLLIATYCVDPYTWQEAEKLAPIFLDAPCTEVLAIGNFTIAKLLALKKNISVTFRREVTLLNKFRLVMIVLAKRLVFTIRYFLWKRKLRSLEKIYLRGL